MQTILSITYVTTIFNHTSPFLTWVICYARVCKNYLANASLKQPCAAMCEICVNQSRTLSKKHTFIFCSSTTVYLVRRRCGVQIWYISSRTTNLMTGIFLLCLSDNCCFCERLSPGRSKTYVTFDITGESCTWSLTASNVCDYWVILTFSVTSRE